LASAPARVAVPIRVPVGQVRFQMGIKLGALDRVSPLPAVNAFDGMTVRVTAHFPRRCKASAVPFETRCQPTTEIGKGATASVGPVGRHQSHQARVDHRRQNRSTPRVRFAPCCTPGAASHCRIETHGYCCRAAFPTAKRYALVSLSRAGSPRDRFATPSKPIAPCARCVGGNRLIPIPRERRLR